MAESHVVSAPARPWRASSNRNDRPVAADRLIAAAILLAVLAGSAGLAGAQGPRSPAERIATQREAMAKLAFMDGVWRGPAWSIMPSGERHDVTQTERIGPFLDGSVKVVEGRGYMADGKVGFNAFGTISWSIEAQKYTLHSYAMGQVGDFPLKPAADGYVWEIPAGPMTIRYTATIKDGKWREVGEQIAAGKDPVQIFEMTLVRVGDTDWPGAGAISPK